MNDDKKIITDEVITEDMVEKADIESLELPVINDEINAEPLEVLDFNSIGEEPKVNNDTLNMVEPIINEVIKPTDEVVKQDEEPVINNDIEPVTETLVQDNESAINEPILPNNKVEESKPIISTNPFANISNLSEIKSTTSEPIKEESNPFEGTTTTLNSNEVFRPDPISVVGANEPIISEKINNASEPINEVLPQNNVEPVANVLPKENEPVINNVIEPVNESKEEIKPIEEPKKEIKSNKELTEKEKKISKGNNRALVIFLIILILFCISGIVLFPLIKDLLGIGEADKDTMLSNAVYDYVEKTKGITAGDEGQVYCFRVQDLIDKKYIDKSNVYDTYLDKSIEVISKDNNISYSLIEECY